MANNRRHHNMVKSCLTGIDRQSTQHPLPVAKLERDDLEMAGLVPADLEDLAAPIPDLQSAEFLCERVRPERFVKLIVRPPTLNSRRCFSSPSNSTTFSSFSARTSRYATRPIALRSLQPRFAVQLVHGGWKRRPKPPPVHTVYIDRPATAPRSRITARKRR